MSTSKKARKLASSGSHDSQVAVQLHEKKLDYAAVNKQSNAQNEPLLRIALGETADGALRYVFAVHERVVRVWDLDSDTMDAQYDYGGSKLTRVDTKNLVFYYTNEQCSSILAWDFKLRKAVPFYSSMAAKDPAQILDFVCGGEWLYVASLEGYLRAWEVSPPRRETIFEGHRGAILSLAHNGADLVFSGGADGDCRMWDMTYVNLFAESTQRLNKTDKCRCVFRGHEDSVLSVKYVNELLYSASKDCSVRKWTQRNGEPVCLLNVEIQRDMSSFNFEVCGKYIFLSSPKAKSVLALDAESGKVAKRFDGHEHGVRHLISDGARYLFTASKEGSLDKYSLRTGKRVVELRGHVGAVNHMLVRAEMIYSCGEDGTVRVWKNIDVSKHDTLKKSGTLKRLKSKRLKEEVLAHDDFVQDKVEQLSVAGRQLRKVVFVPKDLDTMDLVTLDASNNEIDKWPASVFKQMPRLVRVKLADNRLSSLSGLSKTPNLQELDLRRNRIVELPSDFAKYLPNLRRVNLSENSLITLPSNFSTLKRLRYLNLSRNRLDELPAKMERMKLLEELVCYDCSLWRLPPTIGNLADLKRIDVSGNQLTMLPGSLLNLTQATELNIERNPLTFPLPESGVRNMEALMQTLRVYHDKKSDLIGDTARELPKPPRSKKALKKETKAAKKEMKALMQQEATSMYGAPPARSPPSSPRGGAESERPALQRALSDSQTHRARPTSNASSGKAKKLCQNCSLKPPRVKIKLQNGRETKVCETCMAILQKQWEENKQQGMPGKNATLSSSVPPLYTPPDAAASAYATLDEKQMRSGRPSRAPPTAPRGEHAPRKISITKVEMLEDDTSALRAKVSVDKVEPLSDSDDDEPIMSPRGDGQKSKLGTLKLPVAPASTNTSARVTEPGDSERHEKLPEAPEETGSSMRVEAALPQPPIVDEDERGSSSTRQQLPSPPPQDSDSEEAPPPPPIYTMDNDVDGNEEEDDDEEEDEDDKRKVKPSIVVADADYEAKRPGELSLQSGQQVEVLDKHGLWWTARLQDGAGQRRTGIIPSNYVRDALDEMAKEEAGEEKKAEEDDEDGDKEEETNGAQSNGAGAPAQTPLSPRTKEAAVASKEIVVAKHKYVAQETKELGFEKGQRIAVLRRVQPVGWWFGVLVSDGSKRGFFPSTFVVREGDSKMPPAKPTRKASDPGVQRKQSGPPPRKPSRAPAKVEVATSTSTTSTPTDSADAAAKAKAEAEAKARAEAEKATAKAEAEAKAKAEAEAKLKAEAEAEAKAAAEARRMQEELEKERAERLRLAKQLEEEKAERARVEAERERLAEAERELQRRREEEERKLRIERNRLERERMQADLERKQREQREALKADVARREREEASLRRKRIEQESAAAYDALQERRKRQEAEREAQMLDRSLLLLRQTERTESRGSDELGLDFSDLDELNASTDNTGVTNVSVASPVSRPPAARAEPGRLNNVMGNTQAPSTPEQARRASQRAIEATSMAARRPLGAGAVKNVPRQPIGLHSAALRSPNSGAKSGRTPSRPPPKRDVPTRADSATLPTQRPGGANTATSSAAAAAPSKAQTLKLDGPKAELCIALHDYEAAGPGEMTFKRLDILKVLKKVIRERFSSFY